MKRSCIPTAPTAAVLALFVGFAATAAPAAAADVKADPTRTSLSAAATAKVATLKPPARGLRAAQAQAPATAPAEDRGSFFRTRTGVIAIVVMAAGLGYATYSAFKDNDPVHSPIR